MWANCSLEYSCRLDNPHEDPPDPDLLLGLGDSLDLDLLLRLVEFRLVDLLLGDVVDFLEDVDLADLLDLEPDSPDLETLGPSLSIAGVDDCLLGVLKNFWIVMDSPRLKSNFGRPILAGVPPGLSGNAAAPCPSENRLCLASSSTLVSRILLPGLTGSWLSSTGFCPGLFDLAVTSSQG